jgi:hypothetical protein
MDETVLAAVVRPDEAESPASNDPMLKVMHDLEEMAANCLKATLIINPQKQTPPPFEAGFAVSSTSAVNTG